MIKNPKISLYIANNFLARLTQVLLGFSIMIFFINFIDAIEKVKDTETPFYVAIIMAFLQIPDFLNDVIPSLILFSAIITFFFLSSRSEITVMRSSGLSLWNILQPIILSAFFIGIAWITIFNDASIKMNKAFNEFEANYVKHEQRASVEPTAGIWIRQNNIENPDEEIIIQAKKIYQNDVEMNDITLWFFDKDGKFYKKIDAKKMVLRNDTWILEDLTLNDANAINKKLKEYLVKTNLSANFIQQKVVNNFQNVKLFSIFELPDLISELQLSGFSSTKFKVYLQSLLSKPLLFVSMIMIACFFGINHIRNNNSILMIFLGIISGLLLYIISSILNALGSSNLVPIFASTWIITIICLSIGILLIYKKENI
ncbi:MAG: LptF/LptG family permease [Rickettsiales bacterium]|nr:LptF/LptG family permease [Rickettsiales bacterium]